MLVNEADVVIINLTGIIKIMECQWGVVLRLQVTFHSMTYYSNYKDTVDANLCVTFKNCV